MSRQRTGIIWNYFTVENNAEKKATCNYCKKTLSYKSTISNLKLHLKQKHIVIFEEVCNASSRNNNGGGNFGGGRITAAVESKKSLLAPVAGPSSQSVAIDNNQIDLVPVGPPKKVQKMMSTYIPRKLSPAEKAQMDESLLKIITNDFQPFDFVNDEGFRAYSRALNPSYEIPSRKTLSNRILSAKYEDKLNKVKNIIQDFCQKICLTVDCWTSRSMEAYIAVTGHFIHSETLEYVSFLLECSALEGPHTSSNIAQELTRIADSWQIKDKINFLVTDNASNMVNAARILNWCHFGCYVHKLNLIVQEALSLPNVESTIRKVQKTVAHFKRSSQAKEKLLKYQTNAQNVPQGNVKTVMVSIPTRWNSTYLMLQRFSDLQEALRATIPNLNANLPVIPMEEWRNIEELVMVLKPFYEATVTMSTDKYLTASKALVMTQGLTLIYERLLKKELFAPVKQLVQTLKAGLSLRFKDIEQNEAIGLCTYLDPRFKQHAFKSTNALVTLKRVLILKATELNRDDDDVAINCNMAGPDKEDEMSIWSDFDEQIKSINIPRMAHTKAVDEVEMYLKENLIPRTDCPLKWWRDRKALYPSLYSLFIRQCNIVVTSVPCERAFSKSGYIISERRTRLTSSKVHQIMFLNANK